MLVGLFYAPRPRDILPYVNEGGTKWLGRQMVYGT